MKILPEYIDGWSYWTGESFLDKFEDCANEAFVFGFMAAKYPERFKILEDILIENEEKPISINELTYWDNARKHNYDSEKTREYMVFKTVDVTDNFDDDETDDLYKFLSDIGNSSKIYNKRIWEILLFSEKCVACGKIYMEVKERSDNSVMMNCNKCNNLNLFTIEDKIIYRVIDDGLLPLDRPLTHLEIKEVENL